MVSVEREKILRKRYKTVDKTEVRVQIEEVEFCSVKTTRGDLIPYKQRQETQMKCVWVLERIDLDLDMDQGDIIMNILNRK